MDNEYTNKSTDEFLKDKVYILNEEDVIKNMINPVVNRNFNCSWKSSVNEGQEGIKEFIRIQREYEEEHPEVLNVLNPIALDIDSEILAELLTSKGTSTTFEEAKESLVKKHFEEIRCISKPNSVTMFIEDRKSNPQSLFL